MDKVVHFEIPVDDLEGSMEFYKKVFGWKIDKARGMEYYLAGTVEVDKKMMPRESGAINGGIMMRQSPLMHPIITIEVKNIDETLREIKLAGGRVIKSKEAVGDMGYTAYFEDSEGNILGLWQNSKMKSK